MTTATFTINQNVRFKGYAQAEENPLLRAGQIVRIVALKEDDESVVVRALSEDGEATGASETLFFDEVEVIEVIETADAGEAGETATDAGTETPAETAAETGGAEAETPAETAETAKGAKGGKGGNGKGSKAKPTKTAVTAGAVKGAAKAAAATPVTPAANGDAGNDAETAETAETGGATDSRAAEMGQPSAQELDEGGPRSDLVRRALADVATDGNEGSAALIAAKSLVNRVDETYYTLGGVLSYIKETGVYKSLGYDGKRGFADYVKAELGVDYRKAQYLIGLYDAVQAAGLNERRLTEIGWSKAIQIVRVGDISAERLNEDFDALVDYAKEHTRDDLVAHIKKTYEGINTREGSGGTTVNVSTFIFKLSADEAVTAERALTTAKGLAGSDDLNAAFAYILNDWSMMTEGTTITIEDAIQTIKTRFGVDVAVVGEGADALPEAGEGVDAEGEAGETAFANAE